jgi:hypothetical protein
MRMIAFQPYWAYLASASSQEPCLTGLEKRPCCASSWQTTWLYSSKGSLEALRNGPAHVLAKRENERNAIACNEQNEAFMLHRPLFIFAYRIGSPRSWDW